MTGRHRTTRRRHYSPRVREVAAADRRRRIAAAQPLTAEEFAELERADPAMAGAVAQLLIAAEVAT